MAVEPGPREDPDARPTRPTGADAERRNALVSEHLGLARSLARRFAGRGEPFDDLEQVAVEGLLKAAQRFDEDRGSSFAAYAVPTIVGEIKRHFRDHTWATKVPRAAKELSTRLTATTDALTAKLRRAPTVLELSEALDLSLDLVIEALEAHAAYRPSSLSAPADAEGLRTIGDSLATVDSGFAQVDARLTVEGLLAALPERERRILELRYFDELSQEQIATRVGISQMHVSRLLRRVSEVLARSPAPDDGS